MTWRIGLQLALSGLSVGSIYAIIALALAIPYKASRVLNFAQGELVTLGAYIGLVLTSYGLPYAAMVPATLIIAAVFGLVLERLFIRPIISARMIRPMAKVAITRVNSGAQMIGRINSRSSTSPNTAAMIRVAGTMAAYGRP